MDRHTHTLSQSLSTPLPCSFVLLACVSAANRIPGNSSWRSSRQSPYLAYPSRNALAGHRPRRAASTTQTKPASHKEVSHCVPLAAIQVMAVPGHCQYHDHHLAMSRGSLTRHLKPKITTVLSKDLLSSVMSVTVLFMIVQARRKMKEQPGSNPKSFFRIDRRPEAWIDKQGESRDHHEFENKQSRHRDIKTPRHQDTSKTRQGETIKGQLEEQHADKAWWVKVRPSLR